MMKRALVLVASLLFIASSLMAEPSESGSQLTLADLNVAKQKWLASHIDTYEFSLRTVGWIELKKYRPPRITVRKGVVSKVEGSAEEFLSSTAPPTIDDMFSVLEKELRSDRVQRGVSSLHATFDPERGFPVSVSLTDTDKSDSWSRYSIENFHGRRSERANLLANSNWENACYRAFIRDVSDLAGDAAADCGFLHLISSKALFRASTSCVRAAEKHHTAFKQGFEYVGGDTILCAVSIRDPQGTLLSLLVDTNAGQPCPGPDCHPILYARRCKVLKFDNAADGPIPSPEDCADAPDIVARFAKTRRE